MSLAGSSTYDPVDKHDFGSYMVYTNKDGQVRAKNLDTGNIDYKSPVGRAATSADTTSVINGALTALQSTGGLVKLKRGSYLTNHILHIGKSDGSLAGNNIRLTGEGRGISVLKFDPAATPTNMVHGNCNLTLEYLTLDASTHANEMFHCNKGADLITVQYCSFINGGTHFPYWTGDPLKAERIIGNYFGTVTNSDQCASGVDDYSYCVGNVFDKRGQGTGTGSSKTYGGSQNIEFSGNTILRDYGENYQGFGISVEGWGFTLGYKRVNIHDNNIVGGCILVGSQNVQTTSTWDQVNIHHNNVEGGEIRVDGGFGNQAPNNEFAKVNIDHNIVWKPWWGCIMLSNVQGPTTIHGNTLGDSNQSGGTSSQDRANISIQYSNNVDVSDNMFNMLDTATGHNIWGLWSNHWVNGWVHGNSGVNNTANEWFSTQFGGNNTNINVYDNPIWPTVTRGRLDFTGDGTTTTKTITHGAKGILTHPQFISLVSNQNNNPLSVSATTATTIDAKFATAPPASTSVSIYWSVGRTAF